MATPYSLHIYDEVTSTQDVARSLAADRPALVVAGRQTEGRGRSRRTWETAPRAMAASLAFNPIWKVEAWTLIPLLAGLAAADVLPGEIRLKWPNDLLVGSDKVGGILVEGSEPGLVVGCGLNLWWPQAPDGIGSIWADDPGLEAVTATAISWADHLLSRLESGPEQWGRLEYLRLSATVGLDITWEPTGQGRAVDIDDTGALIVKTNTGQERLIAGEITHLRPV
jgi:biotin-[acetyl-CoA-carboxylase] ligase BirA-like protein